VSDFWSCGYRFSHPEGKTVDLQSKDETSHSNEVENVVATFRRALTKQLRAMLPKDANSQDRDALGDQVKATLEAILRQHGATLDESDEETVIAVVLDDVFEFGPLSELMRDTTVTDILVNGPFQIFVERQGQLRSVDANFDDESHLSRIMQRMVSRSGRKLDRTNPIVDVRLRDGSRMNAILNPPAINGPLVSIRRFGSRPLTAEDLLAKGTLTQEILDFLAGCVRSRLNIVIAGGTGSGKTTLLNVLSRYIRRNERIATIEDTAELEIQHPHVVKMEARLADSDGNSEISIRELVKNTLRMRPDRILIGECRGAETLEMLQAMNTGHEGSMTTIHANSPRDAISRIELMIALGGVDVPSASLRKQIAASINIIIQINRQLDGRRKVVSITEITGIEGDMISMHELFRFVQTGTENNAPVGHFEASGIRPNCLERLFRNGVTLSTGLFARRRLDSSEMARNSIHG
jgi:pilus assembly protein CpaF